MRTTMNQTHNMISTEQNSNVGSTNKINRAFTKVSSLLNANTMKRAATSQGLRNSQAIVNFRRTNTKPITTAETTVEKTSYEWQNSEMID